MNSRFIIPFGLIILLAIVVLAITQLTPIQDRPQQVLPVALAPEVTTMTEVVNETDALQNESSSSTLVPAVSNQEDLELSAISERPIMITERIKHSVPLAEILGGGPPKDGIPSIDNPRFVSVSEAAKFLSDDEPGLALSLNGVDRFYPYQILVWHEIVNDTFNGQRVLITYCPLCFSGVVYDPLVQGERVEFGTSGKLWQSNLVMYDRKTESYWSQILGEGIKGEMTGARLKILPSDITKFGLWRAAYPQGQVLSRDTGALRVYGNDPYGNYYTTPGVFFPVSNRDERLDEKEFILGIVIDGQAKAYWPAAIKEKSEVTDEFAGKTIVAKYEANLDAVRLFEKKADGTLARINPLAGFWFSWVAAYPNTALLK